MQWKFVWVIGITLASGRASGAECTQSFSGEWNRELAAGATADEAYHAAGSGWSDHIRVVQEAGRITIESFFFSKSDLQPPLRFTYLPDQGATENVVMVGQGVQRQESTARWSGCRLVISTRFAGGAATAGSVTQTLWMESADTLVVETARDDAGPNRTIYRRVAVAGGM